jgi:hypothetical protein
LNPSTQIKKVRKKNMKELTNSIGKERDDIVKNWYPTRETSSTVMRLLQVIVAHEDDDKEEDPDNYWHP